MSYLLSVTSFVLSGAKYTLGLFAITIMCSVPLGLLLTFVRMGKNRFFGRLVGFYVWIMRGTPLLLQLFFFLYGLPFLPIVGPYLSFGRFTAASLAFILNYSAYFCEIFRGGILSIGKGQYEAAKVLGLSKNCTTLKIVIPQMLKVTLPSITNEHITLVKDTALAAAIGITEILYYAKEAVNSDVNIMGYFAAAAFYLLMTYGITKIFDSLEKKFSY